MVFGMLHAGAVCQMFMGVLQAVLVLPQGHCTRGNELNQALKF